jgi:RNA polymerase sigma-70 factor (ECF subfamily)
MQRAYWSSIRRRRRGPGRAVSSSGFRQSSGSTDDERDVTGNEAADAAVAHGRALADLYDRAVPEVFGYLRPRCGDPAVAEDLLAETFLAACDAIERNQLSAVTVGWLIGIARHKLVDHWRREARHERHLRAVADLTDATDDPWDAHFDAAAIERTLASLSAVNRSALTFRYLDGLSVPEVADLLDRTVPATDQVLARARGAFRRHYGEADR